MAGQTLQTNIVINAIAKGTQEAGSAISQMGSTINELSQQLINFGKESVEVYRTYEQSMADAEVALSTSYGKGTTQLKDVMNQLNAAATEWAATTIFHTDDVANAISETAHAGWDLEEIMTGIPAAMELAAAGNMDLSEAVDYITKTTHAAGIEMEDMGHLIDIWTYAANSSASTVGEFGDAMLKMGSTMKFTANTEELMTLLAATANAGTVGEAAGTQLRNAIIRLIAPTDKAKKAMAELGIESEETAGLLEDESLQAASATLAAHGFSVFDEEGNLKSIIDIFRELYVALGDIAGGYENIEKNTDTLGILTKIFPTRNTTEALNILAGISTNFDDLYEKLINGEAQGYGEYAMHTMMNTLNGDIETFESKYERLKQVVGEQLSGDVSSALGSLGGFLDSLSTMDPELMSALVTGLEAFAAAGPGLVITGAALSFVGKMLTVSGIGISGAGWVLAAAGVAGLAMAMNDLYESHYRDAFGENGLDTEIIQQHIGTLTSEFQKANEEIVKFQGYFETCVTGYEESAKQLNSSLVSIMVTGVTVKEGSDEYNNLKTAGEDMVAALKAGVETKRAEIIQSLLSTQNLGDAQGSTENAGIWAQMMAAINQGFDEEVTKTEQLSKQFRDAMASAFKDGVLTEEELAGIQGIFDQMDAVMARLQSVDNYVEKQRLLRKARTLGVDQAGEVLKETQQLRDTELEQLYQQQDRDYAETRMQYEKWVAAGGYKDENGEWVNITQADMDTALSLLSQSQEQARNVLTAGYEEMMMGIISDLIQESDLSEAWNAAEILMETSRNNGGTLSEADLANWRKYSDQAEFIGKYLSQSIDYLGGTDLIQSYIDFFTGRGQTDTAMKYQNLLDMYNLFFTDGMFNREPSVYKVTEFGEAGAPDAYTTLMSLIGGYWADTEDKAAEIRDALTSGAFAEDGFSWFNILGYDELYGKIKNQAELAGMSISDWIAAAIAGAGETATEEPAEVELEVDDTAVEEYEAPNKFGTIYYSPNGDGLPAESTEDAEDFAEGGRATTASIFGEVGAEWAIPEEHSGRTASLLNAARKASGFSWQELIGMYGGLNADTTGSSRTLIYSPTINTTDANGLEAVLMNDKRRLEKLLKDREMRDEAEVYA